jgi:chloride channel 3/4/5
MFNLIFLFSGLFIPSMAIGAITGRIVGILFETFVYYWPNFFLFAIECSTADEQCVVPGFYAVIGACAFLGGVTRMTVSLVVIMVELTGGLSYSVPLMCAALVSKLVGDALVGEGIYDAHIQLNNYPYLDVKTEFTDQTTAVAVLESKEAKNELIMLPRDDLTLGELIKIVRTYKYNGYPVIASREEGSIIGFVLRRDLQLVIEQRTSINIQSNLNTQISFSRVPHQSNSMHIYRLLNRSPATITLDTPTTTIIDMCRKLGAQTILITNDKGYLTGILTKKDIIAYVKQKKVK